MKTYKEVYTIEYFSTKDLAVTYHFDFGHKFIFGVGKYTSGFTHRDSFWDNIKKSNERHPDHTIKEVSIKEVSIDLKKKMLVYILSREEL